MTIDRPHDVHKKLVTDAEHSWALGLMAYAIVEDAKYEWIAHLKNTDGREPTPEEIENWFRQRTPESFDRAVADAEHALQLVVDDALKDLLETERREVLEKAVIKSVNERTGGWRQFGIGVAAGMVSATLFAIALIILAVIVLDGRSAVDLVRPSDGHQIQKE